MERNCDRGQSNCDRPQQYDRGQRTRLRIPHARDHGRRHLLSASSNIQVYNNNIWYNQNGIVGIEQIEEVAVSTCRVVVSGATELTADSDDNVIFTNNNFWNNTYLRPDGDPLEWNGIRMNSFQWAQTHGPTEKFIFQAY